MFYRQFSRITDALNSEFVEVFDYWLATLPNNKVKNITASLVSAKFEISYSQAEKILRFAESEGIMREYYLIICPNEDCEAIIDMVELQDLASVLMNPIYCHACDNEYNISPDNIYTAYERVKKPDLSEDEINKKISLKLGLKNNISNFTKADSLGCKVKNMFKVFYNPNESAYKEMKRMKEALDGPFPNSKAKGDALEKLSLLLFKEIKFITGTNELKTRTNQFDCTLRFPFSSELFPTVLKYMTPYFVIECKNEEDGPSNTYFHKISNILAGNSAVMGIVISRKPAGDPALMVAREAYLLNEGTSKSRYLISFSDEDLKALIDERKNLLEYVDWKIQNLTTNSKNSKFELFELK